MSLSGTNVFLGIVGVGTAVPALLLFVGFPDMVCQGLASGPYEEWNKSPHAKFGLYAYSISDVCLGALVGTSFAYPALCSTTLALGATAVHQFAYLVAAIPSMGFKKEHIGSIVFGVAAAVLAVTE